MPRDIRVSFMKGRSNFYTITYHRDVLPFGEKGMRRAPKHLSQCELHVKIADVYTIWKQKPIENLRAFVRAHLVDIIGFDFDLTQTGEHTWPHKEKRYPPLSIEENRRFPKTTDAILAALHKKPNVRQIISSHALRIYSDLPNYGKNWPQIMTYINKWYPQGHPFDAIYGRKAPASRPIHKVEHFRHYYDRLHQENHFMTNGTILTLSDLKDTNRVWDVTSCCLVDDSKLINGKINFELFLAPYGIDFVWADPKNNSHLHQLNQQLKLGVTLGDIQTFIPIPEKENKFSLSSSGSHYSLFSSGSFSDDGSGMTTPLNKSVEKDPDNNFSLRSSSPLEEITSSLRNSLVMSR